MDASPFPDWFPWLAMAWIPSVVLLSVLFRRSRGKPVVPKVPPNALYVERSASGRMASNCLIVAVTRETLIVVPRFPFNLMFIPEIYGLEHVIPVASVREVKVSDSRWRNNISIVFGVDGKLGLKVRDPEALAAALRRPA
jgi:hypothetical protein